MRRYWIIALAFVARRVRWRRAAGELLRGDRPARGRLLVGLVFGTARRWTCCSTLSRRRIPTSRSSTAPSPAAAAAMCRSRSPRGCGPAIRPTSGRRSSAARCARGSTPAASPTCPPSTRAPGWIAPCRRRCSTRRPTASRPGVCRPASHRGNVLWFNQRMLRDAGVTAPGPGYTTAAFEADLAKVAASGRTALCLGGKDRFTADRTVREHAARGHRHRRLGQDPRRLVRLAGTSTPAGACGVRADRRPTPTRMPAG